MKLRTSFGLGLVAIALISAPPVSRHWLPPLAAWASQISQYGSDGRNGLSGRTGASGRPGQAQTVQAEGTFRQIEAAGGDGRDGEDGQWGDRAYCPAQPRNVRYDLQAAAGGNGGDGGNGGNGGNGGDVTLYYTNAAQLRQLLVNAAGGRAGRGGRGGQGGEGCRCRDRSWQVEVCRDGNCTHERYVCRDGDYGRYGRNGREGTPGNPGQLWLVNQIEPLLPDQPTLTLPLETWLRQPTPLSKNRWVSRAGASALVASGSVVADTYNEYVGRVEAQAQVVWAAARSQTAFLALSPTVTLQDTGDLQITFPDDYWLDGRTERSGDLTTYTISHIVRADQVTRLAWGTPSGSGRDWAIAVIDLGQESAFVNTQFELTYRTTDDDPRDNRRPRYQERFNGVLPAAAVQQSGDRFVLALGQLPINERYLQRGTLAEIDLRITRSLGANSAVQTLQWRNPL